MSFCTIKMKMSNYKETAGRWLEQANDDLTEAKFSFERGKFSYACFLAEQSAQKSLKGFMIYNKDLNIQIHAISELLKRTVKFNKRFSDLIDRGKELDKYYLGTRYPDALPEPLVPSQSFTKKEANEAVETAQRIFDLVRASEK